MVCIVVAVHIRCAHSTHTLQFQFVLRVMHCMHIKTVLQVRYACIVHA